MNGQVTLAACVLLPLLGAALVAVLRHRPAAAAPVATVAGLLGLLASLTLLVLGPPWQQGGDTISLDLPWIGLLGSRLHLGWDGISAPLVILTGVLTVLSCVYLWFSADTGRPGDTGTTPPPTGLLGCLLLTQAAAVATFLARDLIVFFLAFEAVLIPMWVIVGRWGSRVQIGGRSAGAWTAANRFVLYTALGSAVMLLGLIVLGVRAGTTDFDGLTTAAATLDRPTQIVVAVLLTIGFGVKLPLWPLHSWLPAAHTAAPTVGSVLLAGVLLKLGSYGLVRLLAGMVPAGLQAIAVPLAVLGVVGILWGGLVCLVETDLKRLIAFSSVAHMGFVAVGVASGTREGVQGALFIGVAHGVITGLLFWVVGMIKHRRHTADLTAMPGGMRDSAPRLGWLLALAVIAGTGLPGLAGFWGEILTLFGAWKGTTHLGAAGTWIAVACALGTALAAAYLFRVLYLIWHGAADEEGTTPEPEPDATALEVAVTAPLVAASVVLGVMPWLVLSVTGPAVRLIGGLG